MGWPFINRRDNPSTFRSGLAKASKALSFIGEQVFPTSDARIRPSAF